MYWLILLGALILPLHAGAENPAGSCVVGDCENGTGTYVLSDGTKYVGEFKGKGVAHGHGRISYPSGNTYEGEFADDEYNGMGTFTTAEGTYVGHFRSGKFDGQGTFVYRKGGVYIGQWHNGKYQGQGTYVYATGRTYIGEWDAGKIVKKEGAVAGSSNESPAQ